jgi:uncharacterized protein YecE (DUF72 family)
MVSTATRWRDETPEGFDFTVKAWQLITHEPSSPTYRKADIEIAEDEAHFYGNFRPSGQVLGAWNATVEIAEVLEAALILFQCPPSFEPAEQNMQHMRDFFGEIDRGEFTLAWEPRGDWTADEIAPLCEELGLVHCVDPFDGKPVTDGLRYFRLHGIDGYSYEYTDDDLRRLAEMCEGGEDAWVMFNNTARADDAQRFEKMAE